MDFKKRFDYSNINNFLSDNETVGRAEYYRNKFNNKLPDYCYDLMEIQSKPEYDEVDVEEIIEYIKEYKSSMHKTIIAAFEEAKNMILPDNETVIELVKNCNLIEK